MIKYKTPLSIPEAWDEVALAMAEVALARANVAFIFADQNLFFYKFKIRFE
jgi:hypothetical protein